MLKFLLLVALFAVATYLVVRLLQQRGSGGGGGGTPRPRPRRPAPPPRVIGPDDDEDFLRDLDRKRLNPEDPEA